VIGALDIGGTHVSAARVDVVSATVDPASRVRFSLAEDGDRAGLVGELVRAARAVAGADVERIGVAVPGPFDYERGISLIEHKLAPLYGVDLRRELLDALPETDAVVFVNDADAFLLGEWWAGAARGHERVIGLTLGTGLGSAFLVDGRIVVTGRGVPPQGELYRAPFRGAPVEDAISRRGLLARYKAGGGLDVEELAARAREGDARAAAAFAGFASDLAEFLEPSLAGFRPTCVVVGGSIARAWDLIGAVLEQALPQVAVGAAASIDDAPLLGAARRAAESAS
jgi:glucokinase